MNLPKKIPMKDDDFVRAFTEIEQNGFDKRDMNTIKQGGNEYLTVKIGKRTLKILVED